MTPTERKQKILAKTRYGYEDLCEIVSILRHEEGCPWDREQNHHTIRKGMIEECYEVVEAIDKEDSVLLREELGDVLLQLLFHADIERDAGRFSMEDVADEECRKMIARHPHVFGSAEVASSAEVLRNWETIKTEEKQRVTLEDKLRAIPPMLPALMRAKKVEKKANDASLGAKNPLSTAISELEALSSDGEAVTDGERRAHLGAALQFLSAYAAQTGLEAEEALTVATEKRITDLIEAAKPLASFEKQIKSPAEGAFS